MTTAPTRSTRWTCVRAPTREPSSPRRRAGGGRRHRCMPCPSRCATWWTGTARSAMRPASPRGSSSWRATTVRCGSRRPRCWTWRCASSPSGRRRTPHAASARPSDVPSRSTTGAGWRRASCRSGWHVPPTTIVTGTSWRAAATEARWTRPASRTRMRCHSLRGGRSRPLDSIGMSSPASDCRPWSRCWHGRDRRCRATWPRCWSARRRHGSPVPSTTPPRCGPSPRSFVQQQAGQQHVASPRHAVARMTALLGHGPEAIDDALGRAAGPGAGGARSGGDDGALRPGPGDALDRHGRSGEGRRAAEAGGGPLRVAGDARSGAPRRRDTGHDSAPAAVAAGHGCRASGPRRPSRTGSPSARSRCSGSIANGSRSAEIAARLYLEPSVVERHVANITSKTGISDAAGLRDYALRNGLA